jgi:hypothetical protein
MKSFLSGFRIAIIKKGQILVQIAPPAVCRAPAAPSIAFLIKAFTGVLSDVQLSPFQLSLRAPENSVRKIRDLKNAFLLLLNFPWRVYDMCQSFQDGNML